MNTQTAAYTRTAISLHWLVALLIFAAFPLGLYMSDLPLSPYRLRLYSYHKWIGITIFLLAVLRMAWRLARRPPALPDNMAAWEKHAADGMHWLLYALLFIVPTSGWLMSSAKGFQTVWFGVLPLPDLVGRDKVLGDLLTELHESFNFLMMGVLLVHAGAAVKHHFIDRDDVLVRMLPFLRNRS